MAKERTFTLQFVCNNCGRKFKKAFKVGTEVCPDGGHFIGDLEGRRKAWTECPTCESYSVTKII